MTEQLTLQTETVKDIFERFRKKYPGTKRGLDVEFANFTKKYPKAYFNIVTHLESSLDRQMMEKEAQRKTGQFVASWKNLRTYINQEAWTEEFTIQQNITTHGNTKTSGWQQQSSGDKRASLDRMEDLARAILQNTGDSQVI
jgi:hypothetical protein